MEHRIRPIACDVFFNELRPAAQRPSGDACSVEAAGAAAHRSTRNQMSSTCGKYHWARGGLSEQRLRSLCDNRESVYFDAVVLIVLRVHRSLKGFAGSNTLSRIHWDDRSGTDTSGAVFFHKFRFNQGRRPIPLLPYFPVHGG